MNNDVPVRRHEGLEMQTGLLLGEVPDRVEMVENGILYQVDVKHGQKTGFFLDQKQNRAAIAPLCPGARVLDCFCHNGSFALNAAKYGAKSVLGVDISEDALDVARENAARNALDVAFEAHNCFDFLREQTDAGEKYDLVILDPPAFTKSRQAVESALRGYKEINLRGLKRPAGRISGDMLLLATRIHRGVSGNGQPRRPRREKTRASGGIPHAGSGSSHPARRPGNQIPQVHDSAGYGRLTGPPVKSFPAKGFQAGLSRPLLTVWKVIKSASQCLRLRACQRSELVKNTILTN